MLRALALGRDTLVRVHGTFNEMSDVARQYHCSVTYERQDALDASSYFADENETERGGWRAAGALFGIGFFALGMLALFLLPGRSASPVFIVALVSLSWSVDPMFRDFTRRLLLPSGLSLTTDFSDAGVAIETSDNGSRFTTWSDVAYVIERADGILLVFKSDTSPFPGLDPWYRRLTWIIGTPIIWLPTRAFANYDAKSDLFQFACQFATPSDGGDIAFFRTHIATLAVIALVVTATYATPPLMSKISEIQYQMGVMYLNGDRLHRDEVQGVNFITKAANRGFVPAQSELGSLYLQGHGVLKDEQRAADWYRKAAEAGLAEAQDNLGDLYMTGRGVPKDNKLAEQWFRKAADQGYPHANIDLSILLSEPRN
jgi:hypothetical protein